MRWIKLRGVKFGSTILIRHGLQAVDFKGTKIAHIIQFISQRLKMVLLKALQRNAK